VEGVLGKKLDKWCFQHTDRQEARRMRRAVSSTDMHTHPCSAAEPHKF
jgi:hypothetical protein